MNEEYRKEEARDAGLTTAALTAAVEPNALNKDFDLRAQEKEPKRIEVHVGDASTMKGSRVADAGAAGTLATDVQVARPSFLPKRRRSFEVAGTLSRGALWMNRANPWRWLIVWSRRP